MIDVPAKNILIGRVLHNEHLILRKPEEIALIFKPYPKHLTEIAINLKSVDLGLAFRICSHYLARQEFP